MTDKPDLDELARLLAKATPGPWESIAEVGVENFANSIYAPAGDWDGLLLARVDQNGSTENAAAIVALRNAAPSLIAEVEALRGEVARLREERDTPHVSDFLEAVKLEAAHQRERWGSDHDAGKSPFDWFWLIGYLAQKAADAAVRGDLFKAQHHTISTAAALANWHTALSGGNDAMRPGIIPTEEAEVRAALGEDGK
ncbi:MAG: hypothetical protein ACOY7T_08180 [Pseudomonadota bacterium]